MFPIFDPISITNNRNRPTGTGNPPFTPLLICDVRSNISTSTYLQVITSQHCYSNKSIEELRFEDYCIGNNGRRNLPQANFISNQTPIENSLGTGNHPYHPVQLTDGFELVYLHAITGHYYYSNKSLEELRFEDYCRFGIINRGYNGSVLHNNRNLFSIPVAVNSPWNSFIQNNGNGSHPNHLNTAINATNQPIFSTSGAQEIDPLAAVVSLEDLDPHRFIDPITLEVMIDPVKAADGLTYDRSSIESWFATQRASRRPLTSPLTNLPLSSDILIPDETLKTLYPFYLSSQSTIRMDDIRLTFTDGIHQDLDNLLNLDLLRSLQLSIPKLIVIGNESHGKSTLLERIIGLPIFPREKGLCTRCIIRVHLRRCISKTPMIAEITTRSIGVFSSPESSPIYTALDNIREKVNEVMNDLVANDPRKRLILDDKEIIVKIQSPSCLFLDIIDVPGLVMTIPPGETQNLPEVTGELALRIVEQEKFSSIFLLVNDIRVPPNQSRSCAVIQQAQVERQTLGILTKVDTFISGDEDEVKELENLLSGTAKYSFPVGGKWMATASKKIVSTARTGSGSGSGIRPLEELQLLAAMNKKEEELFQSKYSTLPVGLRNSIGMESIRNRIRELYEGYIQQHWLPKIKDYHQGPLPSVPFQHSYPQETQRNYFF